MKLKNIITFINLCIGTLALP